MVINYNVVSNGNIIGTCTSTSYNIPNAEVHLHDFKPHNDGDWYDLTDAIKNNEPIDWEKLDGRKVKCEHKELGALVNPLVRTTDRRIQEVWGWDDGANYHWRQILISSWKGRDGWKLYIDGPIPLKRKTADQLKPGTGFLGHHHSHALDDGMLMVVMETNEGKFAVYRGAISPLLACTVEVIKEYGVGTLKAGDDK